MMGSLEKVPPTGGTVAAVLILATAVPYRWLVMSSLRKDCCYLPTDRPQPPALAGEIEWAENRDFHLIERPHATFYVLNSTFYMRVATFKCLSRCGCPWQSERHRCTDRWYIFLFVFIQNVLDGSPAMDDEISPSSQSISPFDWETACRPPLSSV